MVTPSSRSEDAPQPQPQPQPVQGGVVAMSAAGSGAGTLRARILGSGFAGVCELMVFHPVDTVAKRLMSSQVNVRGADMAATKANLNEVIFKEHKSKGLMGRYRSLFPGLGFAAGYKILQRSYKFGLQPYVKEYINANYGKDLEKKMSPNVAKTLSAGIAGSIMGAGEVFLLPLDVLKIKSQTNPESLKGKGLMDLLSKPKQLYAGAGWTVARNMPGSFALFGGSAVMYHGFFGLEHQKEASFGQIVVGSIVGSCASITVAAPLDVVKTRVQNRPFDSPESGLRIISRLVANEGPSAFFKGLGPKILVVGPKLIFSYTIAQSLMGYFEKNL